MITTVLFDLDGTLCDLELRYINPFKQAIFEIKPHLTNEEIDRSLDRLWGMLGKKSKLMVIKVIWSIGINLGFSFSQRLVFLRKVGKYYNKAKTTFEFLPDAEETLQTALNNFQVGIVTSGFREDLEIGVKHLPLLQETATIVDMNSVKHPKPSAEPVNLALKRLGAKPESTIFIGDLPTDMQAGNAAGVTTVAYLGTLGKYTKTYLERENPNYIIETHKELKELLLSLSQPQTLAPPIEIPQSKKEKQ